MEHGRCTAAHTLKPCAWILSKGQSRPRDNPTKNKITRKSSVNFKNFRYGFSVWKSDPGGYQKPLDQFSKIEKILSKSNQNSRKINFKNLISEIHIGGYQNLLGQFLNFCFSYSSQYFISGENHTSSVGCKEIRNYFLCLNIHAQIVLKTVNVT